MGKKMLYTLIVAMVLVMGGLIIVQTMLIIRASAIKEAQFTSSVNNALAQVVKRLEIHEEQEAKSIALNEQRSKIGDRGSQTKNQSLQGEVNGQYSLFFSEQNYFSTFRQELKFNFSDTLESSGTDQDPLVTKGLDAPDRLLNLNSERKQRTQTNLDNSLLYTERTLLQDRKLKDRIDSAFLKKTLDENLRTQGIDLNYKFAVITSDLGIEKKIMGDPDFDFKVRTGITKQLFPNDFNETGANWIHIYFPKRSGYILRDTGLLVVPLIILTGLLIGIFTYTILIILRQKKLSMIKNDFINNMTHELKTPISTISLASQMLEDGSITNTPKTIEQISKVINQESKRLSFQVEKVLQMAVFNEGRLKLRFKELDLNNIIANVIANFELRVQNKNGSLITEIEAENAQIKGDEVHITNVIFNLLDNAVKYSNGEPRIVVSTINKKDFVVVSVKDNGVGIPKEHLSQIFERFYRVPTGNVHNVKGFGLGLSYVKKIAEVHNAEIKIESTLNKGTNFSLFFPLNKKYDGTKS